MDTNKTSPALGFETLGLTESVEPVSAVRGNWFGKAAVLAVLACLVVVCVVGVYFLGRAALSPLVLDLDGNPKGHCFVLSPSECSALDVRYVQKLSGIDFPSGAEVVESGATKSLKSGSEWATVRWPEGTTMPENLSGGSASRGESFGGFARIDAVWSIEDGSYDTSVQLGVGTDNRPRLQLLRGWDG
ncbi:hypothetical protein AB4Y63_12275 [Leifsonia sp. YAF41]|uniref:hypothetical protein n=1 Tax=Leifsonia sp. YAF41 TaxID=3233086 RepID=UPI003F94E7CA